MVIRAAQVPADIDRRNVPVANTFRELKRAVCRRASDAELGDMEKS
jgi:hypothetical protein